MPGSTTTGVVVHQEHLGLDPQLWVSAGAREACLLLARYGAMVTAAAIGPLSGGFADLLKGPAGGFADLLKGHDSPDPPDPGPDDPDEPYDLPAEIA